MPWHKNSVYEEGTKLMQNKSMETTDEKAYSFIKWSGQNLIFYVMASGGLVVVGVDNLIVFLERTNNTLQVCGWMDRWTDGWM